jgi:hypothetical protein
MYSDIYFFRQIPGLPHAAAGTSKKVKKNMSGIKSILLQEALRNVWWPKRLATLLVLPHILPPLATRTLQSATNTSRGTHLYLITNSQWPSRIRPVQV